MEHKTRILWAIRFTRYILPPVIALSYFFRSAIGLLFLSIFLYIYASNFSDSKPWSLTDLVLWTDSLPSSDKLGILQSVITVCGFLFAFHTVSKNWKDQELGKLRIQASNDLDDLGSEAGRVSIDIKIIAEQAVTFVDKFKSTGKNRETDFDYFYLVNQLPKLEEARSILAKLSSECHRIGGRHHLVISGIPLAKQGFESAIKSLTAICDAQYFRIPKLSNSSELPIEEFCSNIQYKKCQDYIAVHDEHYDLMNGYLGGARGALLSQITGISLRTILSLKNWDEIEKKFSGTKTQ